jgi:hypothetical protein
MSSRGKAPTMATFIVCLILYLIALAGQFGLISVGAAGGIGLTAWAWIIGFGLLLLAVRVRGL